MQQSIAPLLLQGIQRLDLNGVLYEIVLGSVVAYDRQTFRSELRENLILQQLDEIYTDQLTT